jgi:xylulokinase
VCTLNATKVTDAVGQLLGVDHAELDALALASVAGAGGITLLPYLDGERTPNRPTATGTLAGLRSDTTREQVARAAFEGVACGLLDGLDALSAHAPTSGRVLLVGGGARSGAYRQVLADLLGRPVVVVDGEEHVATGACVQAAMVLHDRPPSAIAGAWGLGHGRVVEPDESVDREAIRAAYASVRDANE